VKVLLLGGGGREHAIGWKLAQSPLLDELVSMPGNPGLAGLGPTVPTVDPTDLTAVTEYAVAKGVDFVVVGPEAPLAAGVVDALEVAGIAVFGPTRAAAQLEASKAFAKEIMMAAAVPTAGAAAFTDVAAAEDHLRGVQPPYVVKADGLAAGKGVLVTERLDAACSWVRRCIDGGFGTAGTTVVIEEHLAGREVSVFAICDGIHARPLAPARDYKRLGDADVGPNTGGMGCYSPVADLPDDLVAWTMRSVIAPVLETMARRGTPFRGFLYAGLMLTDAGPKVLEFNCRLGDPETQVVLPRLEDDLLELLAAASAGNLPDDPLSWRDEAAVDVVLASRGYPEAPETGFPITGIAEAEKDALVFHAGTATHDGGLVTAGGRVLNVVGLGPTTGEARNVAYAAAARIRFDGKTHRSDIGE
jgi:phosphoribosylamine--glycine ligase